MDKKIIAIIAAIVVVFLVVIGGMFWWMKKIEKAVKSSATSETSQATTAGAVPAQDQASQSAVVSSAKNNNDGTVEWYATPTSIATPHIYTDSTGFRAKTWEVGKIISGKNIGDKIILMSLYPEGPGGLTMARFLKKADGGILQLLDGLSNGIYLSGELGGINDKVLDRSPAYGAVINSLEYPGVLYTPKGEKMVKADDFPVNNIDDSLDNIFFRTDLLKHAFTDPVYGDFFTTDQAKINENNSYSVYAKYGFYVKAPDGTFKVYSLAEGILGPNDVADVVWSNGRKNSSKFTNVGPTGCGASKYTDVVDGEVKLADLAPTGKTAKGETVYEYKDRDAKYLKDFYEEDVNFLNSAEGVGEGVLEGKKFVKGMTYDQFVNSHVVFFHQDSFGRLVRFINVDFKADPGGCGKPVIYLYPEKEEKISVKVAPSGGLTVSEPDYGDGWDVVADPLGRIKNLADGKTYPYLFWEGSSKEIYQMSKYGFVAGRDRLENLLDDKLSKLGLNQKEINDFKEFWLPKMLAENKPYYFVTFVPQRKIDELAPLDINPKPDTIIRVLMDYRGLDEKKDAPGYDIKTPERKGFTAVEWGGMLK